MSYKNFADFDSLNGILLENSQTVQKVSSEVNGIVWALVELISFLASDDPAPIGV